MAATVYASHVFDGREDRFPYVELQSMDLRIAHISAGIDLVHICGMGKAGFSEHAQKTMVGMVNARLRRRAWMVAMGHHKLKGNCLRSKLLPRHLRFRLDPWLDRRERASLYVRVVP